jgi:hypothetical protein
MVESNELRCIKTSLVNEAKNKHSNEIIKDSNKSPTSRRFILNGKPGEISKAREMENIINKI